MGERGVCGGDRGGILSSSHRVVVEHSRRSVCHGLLWLQWAHRAMCSRLAGLARFHEVEREAVFYGLPEYYYVYPIRHEDWSGRRYWAGECGIQIHVVFPFRRR